MVTLRHIMQHLECAEAMTDGGTQQAIEYQTARRHVLDLPQADVAEARREINAALKRNGSEVSPTGR